jgi:hypothetical protein
MGDNLIVDVDATVQPQQPPAMLDGGLGVYQTGEGGYASLDGYDPVGWCSQCACPAGSFCFGGATGYTSFDGVCNHLEAGPNPPLAIGCNPPPAGCDASDCLCLFMNLGLSQSCYPECAGTTTPTVYCHNP